MNQEPYPGLCSICVGAFGENSLVEIAGEVDIATVSLLAKALGDAVQNGRGGVILDAQNLVYIDSAGLQTLVSIQHRLTSEGRRMAIVGCHGVFHKLLKITHLEQRFPVYATVDDALADLGSTEQQTK